MSTKVSVVIPVYNGEKYLADCLYSIVNQSLSDVEIIVVNNASNDNSETIIKDFLSKYPNIKYFFQENQGVSSARNKGIENSNGEFLYFLDSDDTISADTLESCYNMAKEQNADFVVCGEADWKEGLKTPPCVWTGSIFVKKSLVDKYNLKFPLDIQPCEDGLFSHFLFAVADKVIYNKNAGYVHRDYETSHSQIVKNRSDVIFKQLPIWLELLEKFYETNKLWDKNPLHLAIFLQKEPFSRFYNYSFSFAQEKYLYDKIKNFYKQFLQKRLNKNDFNFLNKNFKNFINTNFIQYFVSTHLSKFSKKVFSINNEFSRGSKRKVVNICGLKLKLKKQLKKEKFEKTPINISERQGNLSIIIPTMQKDNDILQRLLDTLNCDSSVKEIILIDNSTKGFENIFEKVRVIIPEKNLFVNGSWNAGVNEIKTEYFGILNDDVLIAKNFCSDILAFLDTENSGLFGLAQDSELNITNKDDYSLPQRDLLSIIPMQKTKDTYFWGSAFFGKKENYYEIPQDLKIYCGDNYLLKMNYDNNKTNYEIRGCKVKHLQSLTCRDYNEVLAEDIKNYAKIDERFKEHELYVC